MIAPIRVKTATAPKEARQPMRSATAPVMKRPQKPPTLDPATLRVEGWIPGGARTFTFASSLPVKSYPLVLHCEEDESSTWKWVAGGETSPAYELAPRVVPPRRATVAGRCFALGFDRVLPHGPAPLLRVISRQLDRGCVLVDLA